MLNEFKRPMWNDGYSKEQPWLNYFNSYERMHCCFGDEGGDGADDGGAGSGTIGSTPEGGPPGLSSLKVNIKDQPHNLAWINKEEQSLLKDLGGSGRPGPMGIPAYDDDDYDTDIDEDYDFDQEDISGGMGGDTGGGTGGGDSWGEPDDPNPEDFSWSASKGFTAPSVTSATTADDLETIGVDNITDLGTMNEMYNNPDAYGMGYNDFVDMGFFDKSAAAEYEQEKAEAAALQESYTAKGKDVGISVDRDGNYSYTGKDAGTVGLSEMGKGFGLLGETFGIGSVMGGLDRTFGKGSKDVAQDGGTTAFDTVSGFVGQLASYPFEVATDIIANVADFLGKAVSEVTTTEVDAALSNNQSTSQEAYAQGVNTRDTPFGPMTFDSRDAAMGFNNDYDIGGEDTVPVLPVLPTPEPEPEKEKEPRTAMEAYFDRMGIPSKPKTIPGRSFDFGIPPRPVNSGGDSSSNNNDIFSQEAARRRQMAMASPKYREPSGINSSIAIFAAANGMSYEEAALRFAPPNVPKEMDDVRPTLPVLRPPLTTFAASGGGLNSLMRYK